MKISDFYNMVREDFERLVEIHDYEYPEDWTGGYVFEEKGMQLMRNPNKKTAADIYFDCILYSLQAGFNFKDDHNTGGMKKTEEVREIYLGYVDDEEIDRCWSRLIDL